MNRKPFLKSLSEGRGNCPLPSRTHPQKQTRVVYTEELTHLCLPAPTAVDVTVHADIKHSNPEDSVPVIDQPSPQLNNDGVQ
jgi:hypothetical protein